MEASNQRAPLAQSDVQGASVASFAYSILVADNDGNQFVSIASYRRLVASEFHREEQALFLTGNTCLHNFFLDFLDFYVHFAYRWEQRGGM